MNSKNLNELYIQYNIKNLSFGIVHDKLGDVYEKLCVEILQDKQHLTNFKKEIVNKVDWEYSLFCDILIKNNVSNIINIIEIKASDPIPARMSHGLSKTDVIADISYNNYKHVKYPISVKQSTVKKVAFAEFNVETIVKEIGITNKELIRLLTKHQEDASAKNFTSKEKEDLYNLLKPISRDFVRWVITGSPKISTDLRIPTSIVKFDLDKNDFKLKGYKTYSIEEYIDTIMLDKKGNVKKGGFGTGLSWTYATGSKGRKIQFKG